MFGLAEPIGHDPTFAGLTRVRLGRGAWLDVVRGWCRGHEALFDAVLAAGEWQAWTRMMFDHEVVQPRLSTSWAGEALPEGLDPLADMAGALSARYGVPLTRISANLYRDGRDGVAWHGDTHLRTLPTATVAVLSLGSPRSFKLRPRGGGPSLSWDLGHGDLAVMGGTCQRTWQHAVPKVARAGPRICVMFRAPGWDGPGEG
jgi:alkylated DNA repair dioxygenase AlkB